MPDQRTWGDLERFVKEAWLERTASSSKVEQPRKALWHLNVRRIATYWAGDAENGFDFYVDSIDADGTAVTMYSATYPLSTWADLAVNLVTRWIYQASPPHALIREGQEAFKAIYGDR